MRQDYLKWQEFFMTVAKVCAMRSKDPSTQVGAILVNNLNQIIATGYNGFPRGVVDNNFPWSRDGEWIDTKYPYVAHAELNAIVSSRTNLTDCDLYVTLFPCNECAKIVIQAGIKRIFFLEDKYSDSKEVLASKKMLEASKIQFNKIDNFDVEVKINKNH